MASSVEKLVVCSLVGTAMCTSAGIGSVQSWCIQGSTHTVPMALVKKLYLLSNCAYNNFFSPGCSEANQVAL